MNQLELIHFLDEWIGKESDKLPSEPRAGDFEKLRVLGRMKRLAMEDEDFYKKLLESNAYGTDK